MQAFETACNQLVITQENRKMAQTPVFGHLAVVSA